MVADSLSGYLDKYGSTLADIVLKASKPLHQFHDALPKVHLKRQPYPAQWHRIMATVKAWKAGRRGAVLSMRVGTGKTMCSMVSCHVHAEGKPYRAIVVCPPHLVNKWIREVKATIPNVVCKSIETYVQATHMRHYGEPTCPEFYIISGTRLKLGAKWRAAFVEKTTIDEEGVTLKSCTCPSCGKTVMKKGKREDSVMIPASPADLSKKQMECTECGEKLFQWTHEFDRWPVADFMRKHMRNWFDYFIYDEAHEGRGKTTAAGASAGAMATSVAKRSVFNTGTFMNGYAESLFATLWRLDSSAMESMGYSWTDDRKFTQDYGRIETVTKYDEPIVSNHRASRGKVLRKTVKSKPGIVPSLYGDCLLDKMIFCELDDIGCPLPPLHEFLHPVKMDGEMALEYYSMELAIKQNMSEMLRNGGTSALSMILHTLIGWPDHPYGFDEIGYMDKEVNKWVPVYQPPDLDQDTIRHKEQALLDIVYDAVNRGNQVWVYNQMTVKRDVQERLEKIMLKAGIDCRVLRSHTVDADKREDWMRKNAKAQVCHE